MEKNPMESPIIQKCLDPECQKLYGCTGEKDDCEKKTLGEDGKCTLYEDCANDENTRISHGYCKTECMEKALKGLVDKGKEK